MFGETGLLISVKNVGQGQPARSTQVDLGQRKLTWANMFNFT